MAGVDVVDRSVVSCVWFRLVILVEPDIMVIRVDDCSVAFDTVVLFCVSVVRVVIGGAVIV